MKMKKLLSLALAASMVTVMLTGCGSGNSGQNTAASSSAPAAASSAAPAAATSAAAAATSAEEVAATSAPAADLPAGFNYTPVENTTGKSFKIAVLTVSNNPFWNNVVKGIDTAADYLKKDNVTVDKKEFNDFDGQASRMQSIHVLHRNTMRSAQSVLRIRSFLPLIRQLRQEFRFTRSIRIRQNSQPEWLLSGRIFTLQDLN
jgi:ABC-type sugar transport system substrate-binding protein